MSTLAIALITGLSITLAVCVGLLLFVRKRYQALAAYSRKADKERLALAIEVGELRRQKEFLHYSKGA